MYGHKEQDIDAWMKPGVEAFNFWISFFPTAPLFGVEWRFGPMTGSAAPTDKSGPNGTVAKRRVPAAAAKSAVKADAPKTVAPKTDAPKSDAPKTDAPKTDALKTDAPKTDAPKSVAQKMVAPKAQPSAPFAPAAFSAAAPAEKAAAKTDATVVQLKPAPAATPSKPDSAPKAAAKSPAATAPAKAATAPASTPKAAAKPAGKGGKPASLLATAPAKPDDLKLLKGVGPGLEKQLNKLGVYHFSQIAGFSQADLTWVDDKLTTIKGRCFRDDWIGQAKSLGG